MSEIESILDEVEDLIAQVKPAPAEDQLSRLITSMGRAELAVWGGQIQKCIEKFYPKRRARLAALLLAQSQSPPASGEAQASVARAEVASARHGDDLTSLLTEFEGVLNELSTHHIFQWATYYRDAFREFLDASLPVIEGPNRAAWQRQAKLLIGEHSLEIFSKGRQHATLHGLDSATADAKGISGLSRAVDLCIEWYSANVSPSLQGRQGSAYRTAASTMILGLAMGFTEVRTEQGPLRSLLAGQKAWMSWLPFMRQEDAAALLVDLQVTPDHPVQQAVMPALEAIDALVAEGDTFVPLPVLTEMLRQPTSLRISLQVPLTAPDRQRLDVTCLLSDRGASSTSLKTMLARGDALIVGALAPDARRELGRDSGLEAGVVPLLDGPHGRTEMAEAIKRRISEVIYANLDARSSTRPVNYNFAREFPLNNPILIKHFFVVRTSVRDLLSTFERRNGVRLWCSVRRSGKTTAGFDLGDVTGDSVYLSQTCDSTGQGPNDNFLYESVTRALQQGSQLPGDFLRRQINACVDGQDNLDEQRVVLVLDEYETLFGQLRTSVQFDERLRYTVVQPLLNQFVDFARDNLVVFLGQQPNAHHILMDQNQLSPYVEQVAFPLFRNTGAGRSEFAELIDKVLGSRVQFDESFADRLHLETAGHPFLTVNLLVEFVDWLITRGVPSSRLSFTADDISTFAQARFRRDRLSTTPELSFFRDAVIPEALSPYAREKQPWLYAMYSLIQRIELDSPTSHLVSRSDFAKLVSELGLDRLGFTSDYLLTTGSQSNFLAMSDLSVWPAIRLLGRISAVTRPALVV